MRILRSTLFVTTAVLFCVSSALAQSSKQGVLEIEGPLEAASVENDCLEAPTLGSRRLVCAGQPPPGLWHEASNCGWRGPTPPRHRRTESRRGRFSHKPTGW